jgi:hypothetical protein
MSPNFMSPCYYDRSLEGKPPCTAIRATRNARHASIGRDDRQSQVRVVSFFSNRQLGDAGGTPNAISPH